MTLTRSGWMVLLALSTALFAACGDDTPPKKGVATGCAVNSDCDSGLVCTYQRCHEECQKSADCPNNGRCIVGEADKHVCILPVEDPKCIYRTDCPDPLFCAVDQKCRNQCKENKDCLIEGQICTVSGSCADPQEVDPVTHELKNAVPGFGEGGAGGAGAGGTSGTTSQGGTTSVGQGGAPEAGATAEGGTSSEGGTTAQGGAGAEAGNGTGGTTPFSCDDAGLPCTPPDEVCTDGVIQCVGGVGTCDAVGYLPDGTTCGDSKFCQNHECVDCADGSDCTPPASAVQCRLGKLDCSGATAVCAATSTKAALGTPCNFGVCDANGVCNACNENASCTYQDNNCVAGVIDCSTGAPVCAAGDNAPDGQYCASGKVCDAGECTACSQYAACQPTANPCHKGRVDCQHGVACTDLGANADDGTGCGSNKVCSAGVCVTATRTLTVTAGNNQANKRVEEQLATVTVKLVDDTNQAVPNAIITVTPPPGAAVGTVPATNSAGTSNLPLRLGRAVGPYRFVVSTAGAVPVNVDATAIAPAAGVMVPIVNANRAAGSAGVPGAGIAAQLYYPYGLAIASDDTLYIASRNSCVVYKLTPEGYLTIVAGKAGSCAYNVVENGGPPTSASLNYPNAVALDEANNILYIAETSRVRRVLMGDSPSIEELAGGATTSEAPSPGYGDGGNATDAYLGTPDGVWLTPDKKQLIISDANGSNRLRAVSLDDNSITSWFSAGSCSASSLQFYDCYGGCNLAWDAQGRAFLKARMCGGDMGPSIANGIARVESDNSLVHVAGVYPNNGVTTDDVSARRATLGSVSGLAFDPAGNLFFSESDNHRVRRIDGATGKITTVSGTNGTSGITGDFSAAKGALLYGPRDLLFDSAQNLFIADSYNQEVRAIWKAGATTSVAAKLALAASANGNAQSALVNSLLPISLKAHLQDGAGNDLSAFPVSWSTSAPGAAISSTQSNTDSTGIAEATVRVGLAPGSYSYTATFADIHGANATGSPLTFTSTATAPAVGIIFSAVNINHAGPSSGADDGVPGPASVAQIGQPWGLATASDGTVYFSTRNTCNVYKLTPAGNLTRFAGLGQSSCGSWIAGEEGSLATSQHLNSPTGLALDEAGKRLYIADTSNYRVRVINLTTGVMQTFAGGGTVTTAPFGDGGDPKSATLSTPTYLSLDPSGNLYISDTGHYNIRKVDRSLGTITTWMQAPSVTSCSAAGSLEFYSCNYNGGEGCQIAWAANGDAYFTADARGTTVPGGSSCNIGRVILKRSNGGVLSYVAGTRTTATAITDGVAGNQAYLNITSGLARDSNGNLYIGQYNQHRLLRLNAGDNTINIIAGSGTAGGTGDYGPSNLALVNQVDDVAVTPNGGVLFADYGNYAIRRIW